MHPGRLDLEFAGSRRHRPRLGYAIAHDEGVAGFVAMVGVLGNVVIHLGSERRQQHAPGALPHQCVQVVKSRLEVQHGFAAKLHQGVRALRGSMRLRLGELGRQARRSGEASSVKRSGSGTRASPRLTLTWSCPNAKPAAWRSTVW